MKLNSSSSLLSNNNVSTTTTTNYSVSTKTFETNNNEQMYSQKNTGRQSMLLSSSRLAASQLDDANMNINTTSNLISSRRSSSRALSPLHFPVVNNKPINNTTNNNNTIPPRPVTPKETKFPRDSQSASQQTTTSKNVEKLPDLVSKEGTDSANLSRLSESILNQTKQQDSSRSNQMSANQEKTNELNNNTRIGILKGFFKKKKE